MASCTVCQSPYHETFQHAHAAEQLARVTARARENRAQRALSDVVGATILSRDRCVLLAKMLEHCLELDFFTGIDMTSIVVNFHFLRKAEKETWVTSLPLSWIELECRVDDSGWMMQLILANRELQERYIEIKAGG